MNFRNAQFFRLRLRRVTHCLAFSLLALPLGCAAHTQQAAPPAPIPLARTGAEMTPPFSLESPALLHADGSPAAMSELTARAKSSRYILVGESHDNAGDHAMQASILAALAEAGQRPLLGLEMVDADRQAVLDRFHKGAVSVDGLEAGLDWPETWGYDFSLYRPVFAVAQRHRIPVVALNVPRPVVRTVSAKGMEAVTGDDRRYLPSRLIPPPPMQEARLLAIFQEHAKMRQKAMSAAAAPGTPPKAATRTEAPPEATTQPATPPAPGATGQAGNTGGQALAAERPRPSTASMPPSGGAGLGGAPGTPPGFAVFIRVQSLWDTAMAERAVRAHKREGRPVVILAGGGHVEHGFGIASRLRALDPKAKSLLVMPVRGEAVLALHQGEAAWEEGLPPPGDFLFYTRPQGGSPQGLGLFAHGEQVWVEAVAPGSPAAQAGVRPGDVILRLRGEAVHSLGDMHRLGMAAKKAGKGLRLTVLRDGNSRRVTLPLTAQ